MNGTEGGEGAEDTTGNESMGFGAGVGTGIGAGVGTGI